MAATGTGHPDWIPTQSTPVPIILAYIFDEPAGNWGPVSFDVTGGGAYLITLQNAVGGEVGLTDVTVTHADIDGVTTQVDFYGAVMYGSNSGVATELNSPTVLRGNIYGATITLQGQIATSAYVNAVFGKSGLVASPMQLGLYLLPSGIGDPDPKMSCGSAELNSSGDVTPGSLLYTLANASITHGTGVGPTPMVPFSGPALLQFDVGGLTTTPTNCQIIFAYYTVAGGSGAALYSQNIHVGAASVINLLPYNFPPMLCMITVNNQDSAQALSFNGSIVSSKLA
jgi:hypothetical protein